MTNAGRPSSEAWSQPLFLPWPALMKFTRKGHGWGGNEEEEEEE